MNDDNPPITNAKQLAKAAAYKLAVGAGRASEYWKKFTKNLKSDTDWYLGNFMDKTNKNLGCKHGPLGLHLGCWFFN